MTQQRARYEDISHFRAPYKDSVFSGFGIYEHVPHGAETHGAGEYMPVNGIGEYVPVSGLGADATTPGWTLSPTPEPTAAGAQPTTAPPVAAIGPLFESDGHLVFSTVQGAALIDQMLTPWSTKPTAQALVLANGDIGVLWYVGYDVPPPEAGPASSFVPFSAIASQYMNGYVVLSETGLVNPTPAKRAFIITKNPKTVSDNAREGGVYFISRGGDQGVIDAAKRLVAGGLFASMGPVGTAAVVLAVGAGLYYMLGGKKKKRAA